MGKYISKRIIQIAILLVIYIAVVFFILHAMPGGVKALFVSNPKLTPEAQQAILKAFGLDKSLPVQFLTYMKNFFTLNLGISISHYPTPVWEIIKVRLPRTALLFITATIISFLIGFHSGKVLAWKRGKGVEYVSTVVGVVAYTIFTPVLAFLLIWFFGAYLRLFPLNQFLNPDLWANTSLNSQTIFILLLWTVSIVGTVIFISLILSHYLSRNIKMRKLIFYLPSAISVAVAVLVWAKSPYGIYGADILWHMVLPVVEVTIISYAGIMLVMRDSMLEMVKEDFVTTARAKGLPDRIVRDKHVARTALLPVVTNFVISLGFTIGGGIITETLFSWPGMGLAMFDATVSHDYPLAAGCLIFTGIFVLFAHLVVDIVYAFLDPRIRY